MFAAARNPHVSQVYIRTAKGVLIEVSPHVRIPRTFKRFAGLFGRFTLRICAACSRPHLRPVQLLHKLRIRAADANQTLLRVLKNNVHSIIPAGARVIGTEGALTVWTTALTSHQGRP